VRSAPLETECLGPAPPEWLQAFLYAFVLLDLDGTDMRREPIEVRKAPHRGAAK